MFKWFGNDREKVTSTEKLTDPYRVFEKYRSDKDIETAVIAIIALLVMRTQETNMADDLAMRRNRSHLKEVLNSKNIVLDEDNLDVLIDLYRQAY